MSDEEWTNASRAFRTATAGSAFYLITVDILGPYGIGFSLSTLGWGPGIALYTVFGFMAGYSGYLIWHVFLGVDSYEFPARNYGDLAFRTWGSATRHVTNIMQALGLLLILGKFFSVKVDTWNGHVTPPNQNDNTRKYMLMFVLL